MADTAVLRSGCYGRNRSIVLTGMADTAVHSVRTSPHIAEKDVRLRVLRALRLEGEDRGPACVCASHSSN